MADIQKLKEKELRAILKHNMRENRTYKNEEINPDLTPNNYSLIRRGETAQEADQYRKNIEKELLVYKRKDIVRAVSICITLPRDVKEEQIDLFWHATTDFISSKLVFGERGIISAEVHVDEGTIRKDGTVVYQGQPQCHYLVIPAVRNNRKKNSGDPEYKLCAHEFLKRKFYRNFHPDYQAFLNENYPELTATVHSGVTKGKGYSVDVAKAITKETGMTVDEIRTLVTERDQLRAENYQQQQQILKLEEKLHDRTTEAERLHEHTPTSLQPKNMEQSITQQTIQEQQPAGSPADRTNQILKEMFGDRYHPKIWQNTSDLEIENIHTVTKIPV